MAARRAESEELSGRGRQTNPCDGEVRENRSQGTPKNAVDESYSRED